MFAHIREQVDGDDPNEKLKRIRDIHLAGFEVAHVIHRHGMDDKTAFEVEAALMDAYPGLSNIAGGHGNAEFGVAHAREIVRRYSAEPAEFTHRAVLISVNRSAADVSLYEAIWYGWKVSVKKVQQAEVVLATLQGLIVGAFVADEWLPAPEEHFPAREPVPGRFGFVGRDAPPAIWTQYVGKRVPDAYRKPRSQPREVHVVVTRVVPDTLDRTHVCHPGTGASVAQEPGSGAESVNHLPGPRCPS